MCAALAAVGESDGYGFMGYALLYSVFPVITFLLIKIEIKIQFLCSPFLFFGTSYKVPSSDRISTLPHFKHL